jgi:hypothetical protein
VFLGDRAQVVVLFGTMMVSVDGLARAFASFYVLDMG